MRFQTYLASHPNAALDPAIYPKRSRWRLLTLVKSHEWAFSAAACAELYARHEEEIFLRMVGMSAAAARELASDIAETAGLRQRFESALATGEARRRVLEDVGLAMGLGISGPSSFVYRGTFGYRTHRIPPVAPPAPPGPASSAAVENEDVTSRARRTAGGVAPVIWLGLDGLDREILDRLAAEGKMPNWNVLQWRQHRRLSLFCGLSR